MRRSFGLISVGITAFSIVLLASVVYGLRAAAGSSATIPQAIAAEHVLLQTSPELAGAADVATVRIAPDAAVTLASEFLSRTDAFSVQFGDYNGQPAYIVTFSSGDIVYVSLGGQVLGSVPAVNQMADADPGEKERDGQGGDDGDEHEEDEHEEEHEEEHESAEGN